MTEKIWKCDPARGSHEFRDEEDRCVCGERAQLTIHEKLERMRNDPHLRGPLLSVGEVEELMALRSLLTAARSGYEAVNRMNDEMNADTANLIKDLESFGFPDVEHGEGYISRRLRHGIRLALVREEKFIETLDELDARPGETPELRLRELVTRTKKLAEDARSQANRAMTQRESIARCPGRKKKRGLWEELFLFYLPRCYEWIAPSEEAGKLKNRIAAATEMANEAMATVEEHRR